MGGRGHYGRERALQSHFTELFAAARAALLEYWEDNTVLGKGQSDLDWNPVSSPHYL